MRVAYTSDIHIQGVPENRLIPEIMCELLDSQEIDVFILAGDVANTLEGVEQGLKVLSRIKAVKLFVPGNHDIWIEPGHENSFLKYYSDLVSIAERNNFVPLWMEPYVKNEIAFTGSMGWYDYSFQPAGSGLSFKDFAEKTYGGMTWMDKHKARFYDQKILQSDQDICAHLFHEFVSQVESVERQCKKICSVFHHIPFREMVFYRGFKKWDYFSTFIGADCFGRFLKTQEKVSHVIAGHSHIPQEKKIKRQGMKPIEAHCSPFGYFRTEGIRPVEKWYKKRLSFFKI
ncbi:MAG: metallophosphoesterase [Spirochaetales bacterium]|nr:metallophosphoesterase [Spirochaetales bacterium]